MDAKKGSGRGRNALVVALAVVGALIVVLGGMLLWADRTILDEDGLASLADDLLAQEDVQTAMTEAIVDQILADAPPVAKLARPLLGEIVGGFVGSEQFADILSGGLRRSADLLLNAEAPVVVLEIPDALAGVKVRVAELDPELAAAIPDGARLEALVVKSQAIVRPIRAADTATGVFGWLFLLGGVGLLVGAVYLSRRPSWAGTVVGAAVAGWTAAIAVLLLIVKRLVVGGVADPVNRAALEAAWEVVLRGVQTSMLVLGLIGVLVILVSRLYARDDRPKNWRELGTRPIAAIVLVLGVILVVGPFPGTRVLALLTGLAFFAAGLVWLFPGIAQGRRKKA